MIVDTNAYVISLIKVLLCFMIRDFLIPLFVWRKHLNNKGYSYRFWFCLITQASLQINLVLFLGFLNICNRWTMIIASILIYGLIIWNYSDKGFFRRSGKKYKYLIAAYEQKKLFKHIFWEIQNHLKDFQLRMRSWPVWEYMRKNRLSVLFLLLLTIYNIWFLTYPVMNYHSYQFSDIPVHQSWIYELEHGTLFSDGIYPFGMHAMIYIIRIVSGINLREILLYAGAYQTTILMIGLFILASEIFREKYVSIAAVTISSIMLTQTRYAASLPQEFGMYTVVGIAYFIIRYLHKDRHKFLIERDSKLRRFFRINSYINRQYIDSEMILLMLCVGLVIAYHFYTAIAAIILVAAIGLAYIPKVIKKQYFIPLMFCGIMGAMIALAPMAASLAKGIPFQGSIAWAMSVINGEEWKGSESGYQDQLSNALDNDDDSESNESDFDEETGADKTVDYSMMTTREVIEYYIKSIANVGYIMFKKDSILLMLVCMLLVFFCALVMLLRKRTRIYGYAYLFLVFNMLILLTLGASEELGFPVLIQAARIPTFAEPFIGLIYVLPVDFVFRLLRYFKNKYYQALLHVVSLGVSISMVVMVVVLGWSHSLFYLDPPYYNQSEYLLRHIKQSYEKNTYTIVSPQEEYYDVLDYGHHTQLSEFMNMVNGKQEEFAFPTKYVFFFIEKRVLSDHTYKNVYVNPEFAAMDFVYLADIQDYYYQRAVLESQAYYWAQKALEIYPRNFKVYYEDDIYLAYILEQNIFHPYNLRIDYLSDYRDVTKE